MFSLRNTFEKFGKQLDIEKYLQDLEKFDYLKCQEYALICLYKETNLSKKKQSSEIDNSNESKWKGLHRQKDTFRN